METNRDNFMAHGPNTEFAIPEREVLERTGLNRRTLRENRGVRGQWWDIVANGRVVWSEKGVLALIEKTAGPAGAVELEKAAPAAEPGGVATAPEAPASVPTADAEKTAATNQPETLHVWRAHGYVNRGVLLCARPGETVTPDTARRVMVGGKNADRFMPGMTVLARLRWGQTLVYDFAGNPDAPQVGARLPRWQGRW